MKKALLIPASFCFTPLVLHFQLMRGRGGCLKGAIVGGIAGHFLGHGGIGAAAGYVYGLDRRKTYDRENGYMAALATNNLMETASTEAIE
jgi:hypothetical protein